MQLNCGYLTIGINIQLIINNKCRLILSVVHFCLMTSLDSGRIL